MDVIEIAQKRPPRKPKTRALAVESTLPGLLAMQKWGRITIEEYALACGVSYAQSQRTLKSLRLKGFVTSKRAVAAIGAGPLMYGLTQKRGYALLADEYGVETIGKFVEPAKRTAFTSKFLHKRGIVSAVISADRDIKKSDGGFIESIKTEFRDGDRSGTGLTSLNSIKRVIPDAEIEAGYEDLETIRKFYVESDQGTRSVSSGRASQQGKTVIDQLYAYWEHFKKSGDKFQVLFITTSDQRISNIIDASAYTLTGDRDGLDASAVFRFATHDDVVGSAKSGEPRIHGDFWGRVWRDTGHEDKSALFRSNPSLRVVA